LFEVSAKTGINCAETFNELASTMRERLLSIGRHSDSEDSDNLPSAFHIDGVISGDRKMANMRSFVNVNKCCSGGSSPTFV